MFTRSLLGRALLGRALRAIALRATVGHRPCCGLKTADWILDLSPEGGGEGGRIIAVGMPEQIVRAKRSITEKFLKPYL